MQILTNPLTRKQLGEFLPNQRSILAFENVQRDVGNVGDVLSTSQFVTLAADSNLGAERVLTGDADVTVTDGGAGENVTLGLSDTGVTAGDYGAATKVIMISVDAKGRIVDAAEYPLESGNVTETTNLFYTDARARAALSAGSGIDYNNTTGVIATQGFTGTGNYTNFAIVNGVITAAS